MAPGEPLATPSGPGILGSPAPAESAVPVVVDAASPGASPVAFFTAARAEDLTGAARYLDQSAPPPRARAPEIAGRLLAVINTYLWIDVERVSPLASGDTADRER